MRYLLIILCLLLCGCNSSKTDAGYSELAIVQLCWKSQDAKTKRWACDELDKINKKNEKKEKLIMVDSAGEEWVQVEKNESYFHPNFRPLNVPATKDCWSDTGYNIEFGCVRCCEKIDGDYTNCTRHGTGCP